MFCTNCGNPVDEGAAFCTKCGAETNPDAQDPQAKAARPPVSGIVSFAVRLLGADPAAPELDAAPSSVSHRANAAAIAAVAAKGIAVCFDSFAADSFAAAGFVSAVLAAASYGSSAFLFAAMWRGLECKRPGLSLSTGVVAAVSAVIVLPMVGVCALANTGPLGEPGSLETAATGIAMSSLPAIGLMLGFALETALAGALAVAGVALFRKTSGRGRSVGMALVANAAWSLLSCLIQLFCLVAAVLFAFELDDGEPGFGWKLFSFLCRIPGFLLFRWQTRSVTGLVSAHDNAGDEMKN